MKIRLAYGKTGLNINLPDELNITVIIPKFVKGITDQKGAIRKALKQPIKSLPLIKLVKPSDKIGIIFSDITRPTPNKLILPAIIDELEHIPQQNITLFNALGTHRSNTETELRMMLGDSIVENYQIVQNNANDQSTQAYLGTTSKGHDIWLNQEMIKCDVKILTGFIEPHFFAGFSGGGKAIMPGMAGQQSVLGNHDANMISHPKATWGITEGNPIWEEIHEVALKVGKSFLLNVSLNNKNQITGIFSGDLSAAHKAGCNFVKETAMVPVSHYFDIVIASNSGYPLDLNLYQSVKGMSAAAQIVRKGGTIIVAASCWDGIPDHGLYGQLLKDAKNPKDLLNKIHKPGFLKQDQWQVQIQAQIQLKANVFIHSNNLTPTQIHTAMLQASENIEETLEDVLKKYGHQASICVLPEGPQTIPYVKY